ncbi:hypothetical protein OH77DRAFT_1558017 [Trametes cingulata]|nr:hypothetical protein OH77DRAFT_1558017 [Trametes cingulata]
MRILHKSKRAVAPLPQVAELINKLAETPNEDLPGVLSQIDSWKWPRSDLNAWIKVLNKFDEILEEAIRDYDIDNLQVNVFTPLTKKTICEILRFERLLLENSTNRKTFNSYDRLNSLMFSSDLDVLILALNLLLRPAQQYSSQPAVSHALSISTPRLTSLAKRWPNLRDYDINLVDLVTEKGKAQIEALPTEAREVNFVFYRQAPSSAAAGKEKEKVAAAATAEGDVFDTVAQTPSRKPAVTLGGANNASTSSGAVTIHIDSKTIESKPAMDILADAIEAYSVPDSEKFELLMRIRGAQVMTNAHAADREKLVIVRLLSTAIFGHTHSDSQAQSALFLYEPDLIAHIAELLQLDRGVDVQVQTGAVAALDAMSRYRSKIQDVLTAVNAGVNHGILMALLRKTVSDVAQPTSTLPQPFVEALFSFITFLATHSSGGNMIVGAGLVPVLIQAIENRLPNRLYLVSKTMQLLDNVLYGYNNAFQLFCNARGVDILVDRIEYEVDLDIEECANDGTPNDIVTSYGKLSVARTAVLKHTLRSMHRMMQSSGTSEGLRGLLDSSLLKSVKKILQSRAIFGPSVLALAINIMAIFVHNEPTCLPVIQEAGLPEAFYNIVEKGLEPVIEVIQSIPNAIGALCLNQVGQDQLTARPNIIPSIFSIFTSEEHQRVLQEKENAVLIGTSIEELIRHHPSLKDKVFVSIKSTMAKIEELGKAYTPPNDIKHMYRLQPTAPAPPTTASAVAEAPMEVDAAASVVSQAPESSAQTPGEAPAPRDDLYNRPQDNIIISYIDVFGKFLEGFFQHVPHCRDFVADPEGLDRFARLTSLPCLPYDFANSVGSDSLVQVIRTMAESATTETLAFLLKLVQESLEECKDFWETMEEQSKLLPLVEFAAGEDEEKANERFRKLITLHVRTSLLSDIYATAGYSHGRASATLLQALLGHKPSPLTDLGSLHRACVWENIILKATLSAQDSDASATSNPSAPTSTAPQAQDGQTSASAGERPGETSSTPVAANGTAGGDAAAATPPAKKEDKPKDKNANGLKHIVSQIPSFLTPFFQSVVRLFQTRRSSDVAQKQKIKEAAGILAKVLVHHLERRSCQDKLSLFAYYTAMMGSMTILLVDERPSQKVLHTVLLVAFARVGGLDALFSLCNEFVASVEAISQVPAEQRTESMKQELTHAYGGLKIALMLLQPLVSSRPLFDSTQTPMAITTDKKDTDPEYFEPHNFLVRLRLAALPLVRSVWESSWLVSVPVSISKIVVHLVMEILNGENEEVKDVQSAASLLGAGNIAMPRIAAPGPDENRIRQLIDMGFPRSAAERALVRTRNNVAAAADLLLTHPYPLPPDPEPVEQPAAAEPAPAAVPEGDVDAAPAQVPADGDVQEDAPADVAADAQVDAEGVVRNDTQGGVEGEREDSHGDAAQTASSADADGSIAEGTAEASGSTSDEVPPVPGKSAEEWAKELNAAREPLKEQLGRRVLRLVDEHPSLVFDVQKVFVGPATEYRTQAVKALIDDIHAFSPKAYDVQEQPLSVRCHLLALVLGDPSSPAAQMPDKEAESLVNVLLSLLLANPGDDGNPVIPKWLPAQLLVVESLLVLGEAPRSVTLPKEDEPIVREPISQGVRHIEARNALFEFCMRLLAVPTLPKDELISALRILVLLTRDPGMAESFVKRNGVAMLFQYMKISSGTQSGAGIQSYIAIIMRHIVENPSILQHVMRQQLRQFFSHPRTRVVDVGTFVSGCNSTALRDPEAFVKVTEELCQISHPYATTKTISLKPEPAPNASSQQVPAGDKADKNSEMQVDEPLPQPAQYSPAEATEMLIHYLIGELMKTVKADLSPENAPPDATKPAEVPAGPAPEGTDSGQASSEAKPSPDQVDYTYPCFIMQVITELLFSYDACKVAFLSYSPKKRNQTPAKEGATKHRTAAIQFLLSDLMTFGTINPQPPAEARKQITLCNWAMSVIVALCVDTTVNQDIKDVPTELVSIRKFVLEAISRALKDLPTSENTETRYSRLLALSDLCHRLLTVRFNSGKKAGDEAPTHIAKVMLEKNFVSTLTNVLAEVDLNYPNIRNVVSSVLRPLEYLTKVAMKMSRVSDKNKELPEEEIETSESDISEEEDDEEDETENPESDEATDLYRNSSLGLFGGEMEDVHYDDEDMDDEDGEDEDDDVEMDFGDETGSEDTSATDEDVEEELDEEEGESEDGWQDEEDEEEEDLVENEGEPADEEGEEEEEEEEGDEVMWQDIAVGDGEGDEPGEEPDEEEDAGDMPIAPMDMDDEADVISEGDEFADELGIVDEAHPAPNLFDLAAGVANALATGPFAGLAGGAEGHPVMWTGSVRSTRRRAAGKSYDDLEIFGRPRNLPPASAENVTHPLLVDPATSASRSSQARASRRGQRALLSAGLDAQVFDDAWGEGAMQLVQQLLTHGRAIGHEALHINVPAGVLGSLNRNGRGGAISASIRLERAPRPGESRMEGRSLEPLLTTQRWGEEAKMLHGKFEQARLSKLQNHVIIALLPAAVEAYKKAKEAEEREQERQREEDARAAEAAAKKEQEEREAAEKAKQEEEARAAAEAAAQEAAAASTTPVDPDVEMADATAEGTGGDTALSADSGPQTAESSTTQEGASSAPERITVMIHGNPVDITDTGIDPTFLEALPDDMREEVLNQHVRDQRAAQVERPADSQISAEFLDALPPDIRAEIIQQEAVERAQRTRAEQAAAPVAGAPVDIDPATFIASLDPQLRQVVLMDSDDVFIQSLPSHMIAEANIHREHGRPPRTRHAPAAQDARPAQPQAAQPAKALQPRDAIQLLDKSALAALIRLLFYPHVLKKNLLYKVLVNLCENAKSRTDLFNLLLSILQDGSGDLASIDKSFAQMSVRHTKPTAPQTPKAIGKQRVPTDYFGSLSLPQNDVVPELIVQRCLEALTYIVSSNELSSLFFLTEHELPVGLRRSASKKGKGKEKQAPQTHYPIVLLLSLLDRPSILRTPSIVESVVALLATVTRPLASLKNKIDETGESSKASSTPTTAQPATGASEQAATQAPAPTGTTPASSAPAAPAGSAAPQAAPAEAPPKQPTTVEEKVLLANPPHIPHHVLRLIVNVLTAGECSGRTFAQSLALIQHLSYIPDAREVIASELRARAQEFGQSLHSALEELAAALRNAEADPDALATIIASKFSSASSDQAKLLRVLKTIDYMYSPKTPGNTSDADIEKVQSIYESFRFSSLWQRLGDCLSIIEEKPEMEHIATVLLPLIESLMVVCKYVGPKNASGAAARALRGSASPRSPTTARESMEDLFVSFTDAHRKVLNLMVRNNPSLMSGSFSLLVHNPRVLDFDNKRNYFNQQLHRRPHNREHHGTLQLNVRRQRVFEDSFQYLQRKTGDQIKYGKLSVRFYDEEGVDAGGVTREWFQILARQMFDPNYALFQPCAVDKLTYQPNRASWVNPEHLSFFKFVGRVIGKAIYDGRLLDAYFARSIYKQLLGKPVDYKDVEWVDPEYYNSLVWILENDPSPLDLTFSVEADEFGVTKLVELKEGGASIPVTQENKKEFVQLSANYRLYSSIKDQIEALLAGFYEIIPKDLISIFNERELELLISGTPDIDVDEWRSATEYNGYTSSDPVIVWFWRALKSFTREERAKVLSFATGTSRVPLGGFVELQGVQGTQRFSIHKAYGDPDRLPQAHTCFNQIDLPQYSSYEMLRQQLLLAINEGGEGFGFA